jgi:hypothetical protein
MFRICFIVPLLEERPVPLYLRSSKIGSENALHDPVRGWCKGSSRCQPEHALASEASKLGKWLPRGVFSPISEPRSPPRKKDVRRMVNRESIMLPGLVLWRTRVPTECKVPES